MGNKKQTVKDVVKKNLKKILLRESKMLALKSKEGTFSADDAKKLKTLLEAASKMDEIDGVESPANDYFKEKSEEELLEAANS
jgi:hypothetical protein